MTRRIARLLVAVAVAATMVIAPHATPVRAHEDACAGTGTMWTDAAFYYPVVNINPTTAHFSFAWTLGACAYKVDGIFMAGIMSGWCGLATGTGITYNGHRFSWVDVGGQMVITGEVEGTASITPNFLNGHSCFGGAYNFLVTYAFDKRHCLITKITSPTQVGPLTLWNTICL
jgi:hypothetical protein